MRRTLLVSALILICVVLTGAMLVACTGFQASTDKVASVSLNSYPSDGVTVYQNETPDFSNSYLLVTYESGNTAVVPFTDEGVSIEGLKTSVAGEQFYTVSYGGKSTTASVVVKPLVISDIEINDAPDSIIVVEGNNFVPSGISLRINYTNGSSVVITGIGAEMISGYSTSLKPGKHTVYINYHGASLPITIEVVSKTLSAIEVVSAPDDISYFVGQTFDASGLRLNLIFNNGSSGQVDYEGNEKAFRFVSSTMDPETFEFINTTNGSSVPMTVRYVGNDGEYESDGVQATFSIEIWSVACSSIELEQAPVTIGFKELGEEYVGPSPLSAVVLGDSINWSTGTFTAHYNDGTYLEGVSMDQNDVYLYVNGVGAENMITYKDDYVFDRAGNMTIYVTYGSTGSFIQLTVVVAEPDPIALELKYLGAEELGKEIFFDGDVLVPDNLLYNVRYNNGTTKFDFGSGTEIPADSRVDESMLAAGESFELSYNEANDPDLDGVSEEKITLVYSEYSTGDNPVEYVLTLNVHRLSVTDGEVYLPYKNVYTVGSAIDMNGSALKAELNSGEVRYFDVWTEEVTAESEVYTADGEIFTSNPFGMVGEYVLKIDYLGMPIEYPFEVIEGNYGNIAVYYDNGSPVTAWQTLQFATYEDLASSASGFELRLEDSGEIVPWNDSSVVVRNNTGTGERVVAFIYKGYSYALLTVNFTGNSLSSLEIQKAPAKTIYSSGESFDPTGMILQAVSEDGTVKTVSASDSSIYCGALPDEADAPMLFELAVHYRGAVTYLDLIIVPEGVEAVSLELVADGVSDTEDYDFLVTKFESLMFYYVDESGSVQQLHFAVRFNDGSYIEVPLSQAFVPYSGDSVNPGDDPLIKTQIIFDTLYTELKLYFSERVLSGIEIAVLPSRLNYVEGQQLVVEGGFLRRIYGEGSNVEYDIIPMTNGLVTLNGYRVSPFTPNTVGSAMSQTVEVAYLGRVVTFNVTTYRKLNPSSTDGADYGVSLDNIALEYGNNSKSPVASMNIPVGDFAEFTPSMTIEYMVDGAWTTIVPVYPGEYSVRVIVEENECFNGAELYMPVSFERYKRVLMVTVVDSQKVYGSSDPLSYEYLIDEGDLLETDRINLVFSREPGEDFGSYAVTAQFGDGEGFQNDYYMLVPINGELTITKRVVTNSPGMPVVTVRFEPATTTGYFNGVFTYTGYAIAGFKIYYTDENGANIQIAANDIVYCDSAGNELGYIPYAVGNYIVRISDNYEINGETSFEFRIA